MLEYVRVCPKCSHATIESAGDICSAPDCGAYLGFVMPIPPTDVIDKQPSEFKDQPPQSQKNDCRSPQDTTQTGNKQPEKITSRYEHPAILYLDLPGTSQVYEVKSGWILGLEHHTSTAQIQLPYTDGQPRPIHREHVSFACENGQWLVKAIDHASDTNPTFVNAARIQPGQRAVMKNGDRLTLSNFTLQVRIIKS